MEQLELFEQSSHLDWPYLVDCLLLVEEFSDWWNELELDLPLLLAGVDHEFTIELREESTLTGMLAVGRGYW